MLTTVLRFCPTSAGSRGQSHTWVTQGNPNRAPKQQEIRLQQHSLTVKQVANMRNLGPSIPNQLYSGLALSQLGTGGRFHTPATQGDPIKNPKKPETRPKKVFFFVCLTVK